MAGEQIVSEIVAQTNSELMLFFVLMLVMLVVFFIPFYRMQAKDRKERREFDERESKARLEAENMRQDKYIEREKQIIQVIKENTEVMSNLNMTMKANGEVTAAALIKIDDALRRVHERIDNTPDKSDIQEIRDDIKSIFKYIKTDD